MAYGYQTPPQRFSIAQAVPAQHLLGQVLGITAIGLLITALATSLFQNVAGQGLGFIALIVGFILLFVINATRANPVLSLALFYAFTFLEGIGIAPIVSYYTQLDGPEVVTQAAMTTGLGMFALGTIVYATGLDLRRFAGYFYLALIVAILAGIVSAFTHWIHPTAYAWVVLVIFCGLVLIDFARIRAGGDNLTPVQLAVQIYLDAINIFLLVLQILGGRRRD